MTEVEIRKAVISRLEASPAGVDAAFISEMFLNNFSRRADLVMANGKLCAFEIKSSLDSLDRLEGQLETYQRFFEQVTVVCATKHLVGVEAGTHSDVGIWSVSHDGQLSVTRRAKTRQILSKQTWLSFLPVDELRAFLREGKTRSTGNRSDLLLGADQASLIRIRAYVLSFLKRRTHRIEDRLAKREMRRVAGQGIPNVNYEARLDAYVCQQKMINSQTVAIPRRVS